MGSALVGVQCSLTSSLVEFPGYLDWLWYPGLPPVLVSIAFPFAFHIRCFSIHFSSPAIGFHSCFFFMADPFGRPFTYSLSFQAWDWLWYPMLWSQRRDRGAHGAEISIQISAQAGVEPWTLASSGRERYH